MDFRRALSAEETLQWGELVARLDEVQLNEERDRVVWAWVGGGGTTRSAYKQMIRGRVTRYNLKLFSVAIVMWSFWIVCDKMTTEGVFPRAPTDIIFKIYTCMQK